MTADRFGPEAVERDLEAQRGERAVALAPTEAICRALIAGEAVPLAALVPDAVQRYGIRNGVTGDRVGLDDFNTIPMPDAEKSAGQPAEAASAKASQPPPAEHSAPWFESAADLLAEPDPGPTPFLIDELIVDASICAFVGGPKHGKTWTLLDLAIAVAAGEAALGRFQVDQPGPVLLILEESGRAALHRRLDMLVRGRAMEPGRLVEFYFAANKRVRLNDEVWRERLLDAARSREWRLIAFDPLARLKGGTVDENSQLEMGPVLDFLRDVRDECGATVAYVHHTGHEGTRQRGSSDLEAYWESKLTLVKKDGKRTLSVEHREAEAAGPFQLSFGFDATTSSLRLRASLGELEEKVRDYLDEHPDASANEVFENVGGNRPRVLELVREIRDEGGTNPPVPPGTTPSGSGERSGTGGRAYKAPGTTPADEVGEPVPTSRYHPLGEGEDADEVERLADLSRDLHTKASLDARKEHGHG